MKLFDFAYCGNYDAKLSNLAELSPEKWSFAGQNDNGILRNYIDHTFEKLYDEHNKVVEMEDYAIFNTGLLDEYYKPIYAYFKKNENYQRQKWFLDGFFTQYQMATLGVQNFPERADYFSDPSELIFDTHLSIVPQYDHIFSNAENYVRLPDEVQKSCMKTQLFDGVLETTKRMLEANYKIAVPQFYKGKIQLLVPLGFRDPKKVDLALTCEKTQDKTKYLGATCLTLEMAYNNARLIAKPESNWLQA